MKQIKEDWLEDLIRDYYGIVYRKMIADLKGDEATAEDLTQEVFLSAHRFKKKFRGDSRPSTWLYTITQRIFLMHLRKKKQAGKPIIDDREFCDIKQSEYLYPQTYEMHDPIDNEKYKSLLDPVDIQIATLTYQGLSSVEVGQILDMTSPAVKSRKHRIKLKLREPKRWRRLTRRSKKPKTTILAPKVYEFKPRQIKRIMPILRTKKRRSTKTLIKLREWGGVYKRVSNG
jgi:RNA polymerase sigma-70 factor (ECF subfamily)